MALPKDEYSDENFMVGDNSKTGTLIGDRQPDDSYSRKNSIGEAFDILQEGNVDVEREQEIRIKNVAMEKSIPQKVVDEKEVTTTKDGKFSIDIKGA